MSLNSENHGFLIFFISTLIVTQLRWADSYNYNDIAQKGSDCKEQFRSAYNNRYTWGQEFTGYEGICTCEYQNNIYNKLESNSFLYSPNTYILRICWKLV